MKNSVFSNYKVFAGNSHTELAEEIASIMGKPLGRATVNKFSDGEISVNLWETVRGSDCYIVQSTSDPVNDNLMELLIMIDAMPDRTGRPRPEILSQPSWLRISWWPLGRTEFLRWIFMPLRYRAILISLSIIWWVCLSWPNILRIRIWKM